MAAAIKAVRERKRAEAAAAMAEAQANMDADGGFGGAGNFGGMPGMEFIAPPSARTTGSRVSAFSQLQQVNPEGGYDESGDYKDAEGGEESARSTATNETRYREKSKWSHPLNQKIFYWQPRVRKYYMNFNIQMMVAALIFANFVVNAAEAQVPLYTGPIFAGFEYFFTIVFTIELIVNMYATWASEFWCSGWNQFDFLVVMISIMSMTLSGLPGISTLRLMRAFRVFRLFKRLDSLRQVVKALEESIPGVSNAFAILILIMAIYAILGVQFYRTVDPDNFVNFSMSMLTMFQVMTGDGWLSGIGRPLIVYSPASAFYLITYFLLTSLVLTNVVIAVLLDKFVGGDIPDLTPEEMQIEMMLDKLAEDKDGMSEEMELELPEELKGWLESNTFKKECVKKFYEADEDGSGALEPDEVLPLIRGMLPEALQDALNIQHAQRFISIFDEDSDGEIGKDEFAGFCKFVVLVAHMASQSKVTKEDLEAQKDGEGGMRALERTQEELVLKIDEMSTTQVTLLEHQSALLKLMAHAEGRVESMSQGLQMVLDAQQSGVALGRAISCTPHVVSGLPVPTNGVKGDTLVKDENNHVVAEPSVSAGQSGDVYQPGSQRGMEARTETVTGAMGVDSPQVVGEQDSDMSFSQCREALSMVRHAIDHLERSINSAQEANQRRHRQLVSEQEAIRKQIDTERDETGSKPPVDELNADIHELQQQMMMIQHRVSRAMSQSAYQVHPAVATDMEPIPEAGSQTGSEMGSAAAEIMSQTFPTSSQQSHFRHYPQHASQHPLPPQGNGIGPQDHYRQQHQQQQQQHYDPRHGVPQAPSQHQGHGHQPQRHYQPHMIPPETLGAGPGPLAQAGANVGGGEPTGWPPDIPIRDPQVGSRDAAEAIFHQQQRVRDPSHKTGRESREPGVLPVHGRQVGSHHEQDHSTQPQLDPQPQQQAPLQYRSAPSTQHQIPPHLQPLPSAGPAQPHFQSHVRHQQPPQQHMQETQTFHHSSSAPQAGHPAPTSHSQHPPHAPGPRPSR